MSVAALPPGGRSGEPVGHRELADLVADRANAEGANDSPWPGLTYFRFCCAAAAQDEIVTSLSLCVVTQGLQRVQAENRSHLCGPGSFLVIPPGSRLVADVLETSRDEPLLSLMLQIDPALAADLFDQIE